MRAKLATAPLPIAVLALMGPLAAAQERTPLAISDIRQETTDRSTRLTVVCNGPLAYTYYSPDPLTLVVDLPEVDAAKLPSRVNVGTREVESLRVTAMARADGRTLTRLEVRLASLVPYQIYSKDKNLHLVFERPAEAGQAKRPVAPPVEPEAAPKPPAEAKAAPTAVDAPAPEGRPAAETREAPKSEPKPTAEARVPAPAKAEAKSAESRTPRATRIIGLSQSSEDGQLAIAIKADGSLKHQDFFLGNPDRLVVDFSDVLARTAVRSLEVNAGPVKKVRLGQFSDGTPKVARLVLDLQARAPYHIVEEAYGVRIVFGKGEAPAPAPLAALKADPEPVPAALAPAPVPVPVPVAPEPQASPEGFEARAVSQPEKKYTGEPISLDFKDGDLQDVLRLFADISGLNIVQNPGVSGKVTLTLKNVPWDQALEIILKINGLGQVREDNVIRIARLNDLQAEQTQKRKLEEEQALAGPIEVYRRTLSYAKAGELQPTLKAAVLSSRGDITIDARTNTMIIRDLPDRLEKSKELIGELDRPTKQVEIEARIVVTSRNFTRDLGIQWGFLNEQSQRLGTQTTSSFPNQIVVNGGAVPGGGIAPALSEGGAVVGRAGRGYAVNLPASGFNSALGINLGNIIGSFSIDAALTALERQGRGRLLSTPKVTTQDNKAATIKQGVQIPIQTVANNTVTVTFKDAVLTLQVTPQITQADTVILQVNVENNAADFGNLVNGIPPITTQSANTNVLVPDGATTVIGGIYQSNETTSQQSTPFFSKIPILGYLFRNRSILSTNNELLIFITPRIVKT